MEERQLGIYTIQVSQRINTLNCDQCVQFFYVAGVMSFSLPS